MALDKVLYTAHATSTGGRAGTSESSDGVLKLALSTQLDDIAESVG